MEPARPTGWPLTQALTDGDAGNDDAWVLVTRKLMASFAIMTAATGLITFATFGAFDNQQDPFPHSVSAR
jgi:hypothetical protein